jgi:peptidoglycan/LPS O-acetylase OafA/YrhL
VTRTPKPLLLRRLTAMRAFAALAVFIIHLDLHDVAALPWGLSRVGGLGVAFFFVLSGFVLAWGTEPNLQARTFYRRRFARVYPSDFATLLIASIVPAVAVARSWKAAIANAFMLQGWFRSDAVAYGMNGVSWSLSCEAFFYACFPAMVSFIRRVRPWVGWTLAYAGLGLAVIAYVLKPGVADHLPLVRVSEFFIGVVAGLAFRDGWRPHVPTSLVVSILIFAVALSKVIATPVANAVMAVPFLILIVHGASNDLNRRPGWLSSRMLVFAGEASFAFYLVHELVIVNMRPVLAEEPILQVLVMTVVASTSALALHLFIERPFNRLLRDRVPSLALASTTQDEPASQPARCT